MDLSETQWEEVEEAKEISQNSGVDLEKGTDAGISAPLLGLSVGMELLL